VRVRHAAITSIALLCNDLAPEIEKRHHKAIIEALWKAMEDDNIKIKTQAVSCLVNFCRGVVDKCSDIMENYAGTLLERLAGLFQLSLTSNFVPLQAEVLSCMSMIATVIRSKFAQYYSTFLPGLKNLLANTPMATPRQKELRANTIKTIGAMLYAMADIKENRQTVLTDAKTIILGLLGLLDSKLPDDDPQITTIYNFWGEVAYLLEGDIAEYLPRILPPLFAAAKEDITVKVSDPQNPVQDESATDVVLNLPNVNISVNTQAFHMKMLATNVLHEVCGNAKKAFRPYVEEMARIVVNLLQTKASATIRRIAARYFRALLHACDTKEEMLKVFEFLYPTFREAILNAVKDENYRDLKCLIKELSGACEHFRNGPPMLSAEGMLDLCDVLHQALSCYDKLLKEKDHELKASKDFEEDEIEEIKEEIDRMGKITTYAMDTAGILGKLYGLQCEAVFSSKLIPHYVQFWQNPELPSRLRLAAICFICDVLEYLHGASVPPPFHPLL
jgi:hypothetical protein